MTTPCEASRRRLPDVHHHRIQPDAARRRGRDQFFLAAVRNARVRAHSQGGRSAAARWGALIVGFFGVLIVAAPGADTFQIGALFALANAVIYGSVTAAVRGMTTTEIAETLTMYQMVVLTLIFAAFLPFGFVMPTAGDGALMVINGATNALGQYWWTRALHLAPASAVTPFFYFSLVWAIILGFAVWGDLPTVGLLIGSAIVVASGLFLLWRESRR